MPFGMLVALALPMHLPLLALALGAALAAQAPVANINARPRADGHGSQVVASGSQVFFALSDELTPHMAGLWATGGTPASTRLVKGAIPPTRIAAVTGGVLFSLGYESVEH